MDAPAGEPVEIDKSFVGLPSPVVGRYGPGGHPLQGLWHAPLGHRPTVGFIATHYNVDFSEHYLAELMARRGYGFLGWNTRFRGSEEHFLLDHAVAEIGVGVRWMREVAGIETIVLLGNSGGGSLMAAYHAQAVAPGLKPTWDLNPLDCIDDLIPGDLFVFVAAHPGRPDIFANWLDAAVNDESDPTAIDPRLDIYNPDNGPVFEPDFVAEVRAAQQQRSARITRWCKQELPTIARHGIRDRLFVVPRVWADPRFVDATLDPNRRRPNECYLGDPRRANRGVHGVGQVSTLRTWLSMWSLSDSQCRAEPHLAHLHVPTLLVEADGDTGVFPSDGDALFDAIAAEDKVRMRRAGDHYFRTPVGARDRLADAIADWVDKRV
ncbi:MAG: alpha/beta hydrolase [Actinomycetota bacterium]